MRNARIPRCYIGSLSNAALGETPLPLNLDNSAIQPSHPIELNKRLSHHLGTVLRLSSGQQLDVFADDGVSWLAELATSGKQCSIRLLEPRHDAAESPLESVLVQGLATGDRMDTSIRMATELGVTEIQPISTRHSKVRLQGERALKKVNHWQAIAISAAEQSGRSVVPRIQPPIELKNYLQCLLPTSNAEQRWVLSPAPEDGSPTSQTVQNAATSTSNPSTESGHDSSPANSNGHVTLLVGPESGLDTDEVQQAVAAGFTPMVIGPRILRTETAGPAALAIVQARLGDLGNLGQ